MMLLKNINNCYYFSIILIFTIFFIYPIYCIPSSSNNNNNHHYKDSRPSLKSTLIAEHSRKTHKDYRILSNGESNSIENILNQQQEQQEQNFETFAQRSHRRAFEEASGQDGSRMPIPMPVLSADEEETLASFEDKKNPFLIPNFDENYKTHSICEEWNSGQQGNNVNLEWTESADRLLRIIGNGVVKNGYNMFMAPGASQKVPTNVSVAVYIESMSSFRAQTMDYEVDMYLAMGWYDRRLAHNCTHPILVTHKFIADRIWQPDLYFVNSKFAYLQEVTTPNFMLIVYPDGLIFKSMRIDVTLSCMMDLKRFPMDKQECPMVIQSYAYVENLVNLSWHIDPPTFPIGSNTEIKLNDMQITNTRFEKCEGPYPMFRGYGNWSCVRGFIVMKRLVMFHVIQTYIPTGMLVFISWMSFWLDPRASPARITLTITTLLTLTTMSNGARQDLPQVAYIKMLDLWLSFNQGLIFMVLLEYSIVSYFLTRRKLDCEHRKPLSYSPSLCSHLHKSASKEDLKQQQQPQFQRFRPHAPGSGGAAAGLDSPLIGGGHICGGGIATPQNGFNCGGIGGGAVPIPTANGTTYMRQRHFSMDNGHGKVSAQNSNFSINHGIGHCVNSAAALCRFATVNSANLRYRGSRQSWSDIEAETTALMAATNNSNAPYNKFDWTKPCSKCAYENEIVARKIDQRSRILFPSAFGIFCFAYWFYYGYWDNQ